MIEILQEITDWRDENISNGIYHVNQSGGLVAYQPATGKLKTFKKPIKGFSKARRKFKRIGFVKEEFDKDVITVEGSNGNIYTIINGKCSCPGFKFRRKCKHV